MIDALTSLRFLAAMMIVFLHVHSAFLPAVVVDPLLLEQGITFFFVLSGFVMCHAYGTAPARIPAGSFYLARFARIWPLHGAMAVAWLMFDIRSPFWTNPLHASGAAVIGLNLLLVHAWIPVAAVHYSVNQVSWSLSTEVFFYLLFPFLMRLRTRPLLWFLAGSSGVALALVATCVLLAMGDWQSVSNWSPSATGILKVNPIARLPEFMLGMLACRFAAEGSRADVMGLVAAAVVALFAAAFLYVSRSVASPASPVAESVAAMCAAPVFAACIAAVARGRGAIARLLSNRCLLFLGEISYAIYLCHLPLFLVFQRELLVSPIAPTAVLLPVYLTMLVVLASVLHVGLESPLRAVIRRRAAL